MRFWILLHLILKKNSTWKFRVLPIQSTNKNKELSQVRSKNIEAFIKFQFEDKVNTIHAIGLGESNLKDFEKNRRADLIFKKLDYSMEAKMKNKLEGQTLILEGLNFHPGQAKLIPEAIPEAYKLFLFLANNPLVKIEIHGHVWGQYQSENESKRKQALDLSEERAKNIYDYLIFKGIDKNRLSFKGFGFDHPLEDPLAGMKNREWKF
ncbi:MAG: OmpA family protein [Saprospiraceae bacterium]